MRRGRLAWLSAQSLGLLLGLLARVPEGLAYRAAEALGLLFWALVPGRRRLAAEHLGLALRLDPAHPRVRSLVRRSAGALFRVALDFARLPRWIRSGRLLERVETGAFQRTFEQAGPGGLIVVTGHLGSWEVAGAAFARLRGEVHVIGRRMENPYLDRVLREGRERAGLRVHPRRGGIRPLVAALASGKDCALLLDQNQRKRALFVPVFGRLAATDRSAAILALRMGATVLVGCALREGRGFRFRMAAAPLLRPTARELAQRDAAGFTRRIMEALEGLILAHPEQYLWVHRRYRTRPPEEAAAVLDGGLAPPAR